MNTELALPVKAIELKVGEITRELETASPSIAGLARKAADLFVNDAESEAEATAVILETRRLGKDLEAKREATAGLLRKWADTFNRIVKPHADKLAAAEKELGRKVGAYKQRQEEIRQAELKANAAAIAAEDERLKKEQDDAARAFVEESQVAKAFGEERPALPEVLKTAPVNVFMPAKVETKNTGEAGSVSLKGTPKYEITDISKIPQEFWMINETAIGRQVRAGVMNIPGVRIWIEMGVGRVNLKK